MTYYDWRPVEYWWYIYIGWKGYFSYYGRSDDVGLVKPGAFAVLNEDMDANEKLKNDLLKYYKNGLAKY